MTEKLLMQEAPDLVEPVVGFRTWRLVDSQLKSPFVDVFWTERGMIARCLRPGTSDPGHRAPDLRCGCGIYAAFGPSSCLRSPLDAVGAVKAWGDIQVHPVGFRAEQVEIVALGVRSGWGGRVNRTCRAIASALGIDVVEPAELEFAAREHGSPISPRLIPGCDG